MGSRLEKKEQGGIMSIFNRRPLQAPRFAARIIFAAVLGLAAAG